MLRLSLPEQALPGRDFSSSRRHGPPPGASRAGRFPSASRTITAETELRCLMFVAWVFRPFAVEHPESAWALLEMMVQRVRDAESR